MHQKIIDFFMNRPLIRSIQEEKLSLLLESTTYINSKQSKLEFLKLELLSLKDEARGITKNLQD